MILWSIPGSQNVTWCSDVESSKTCRALRTWVMSEFSLICYQNAGAIGEFNLAKLRTTQCGFKWMSKSITSSSQRWLTEYVYIHEVRAEMSDAPRLGQVFNKAIDNNFTSQDINRWSIHYSPLVQPIMGVVNRTSEETVSLLIHWVIYWDSPEYCNFIFKRPPFFFQSFYCSAFLNNIFDVKIILVCFQYLTGAIVSG